MRNLIALACLLLNGVSVPALADTDHYFRRDGGLVQHLKITKTNAETAVLVDVDFAGGGEGGGVCSAQISDEAKFESPEILVLKKQVEGEARYCTVKIKLQGNEAILEETEDCDYFHGDHCKFESGGKALTKVQ